MSYKLHLQSVFFALLLVSITNLGGTPAIVPLPQHVETRPGMFTLCPSNGFSSGPAVVQILVDSTTRKEGQYLASMLARSTGYHFGVRQTSSAEPIKGAILLTTAYGNTNLGGEGYDLSILPDSVVIRSSGGAGVFYGVQTFLQCLPPQIYALRPVQGVTWTAPCLQIQDSPRFKWRGCMLDVVRHFFTKDEVKQFLDAMALHKLNVFHWHLVDDQGWRIEILKYPLLTEIGAWRHGINWGQNPKSSTAWRSDGLYGGFYTQADIREIVVYAQARHITVVPEIEMPGHSIAAAASYPQYFCNPSLDYDMDTLTNGPGVFCLANPATKPFLQDILREVIDLFPGPYIHIGGDEVKSNYWAGHALDRAMTNQLGISSWQKYQSQFSQQMANWLQSQGRTLVGWSEVENGGIVTNAVCMDWLNNKAVPVASAMQPVVMTPNSYCYYNYYQYTGALWSVEPPGQGGNLPLSKAYSFEPIPATLPSQYTNYILGAQANLWSEWLPSMKDAQFRLYPRLCAMAELDWLSPNLKDFADFSQRLVIHQLRLEQVGVNYNRGVLPQIGAWTPAQTPATYAAWEWNVTGHVIGAGEVDVSFCYVSGRNGLEVQWVALMENGQELDRDTHPGYAGPNSTDPRYNNARYVLRLPVRRPSATYIIRASVQGQGGTDSAGNVYLPNWN